MPITYTISAPCGKCRAPLYSGVITTEDVGGWLSAFQPTELTCENCKVTSVVAREFLDVSRLQSENEL
jgi:hypothetical protein